MKNNNETIEIGIYFIPKNGKFYSLGSKIIGYDIRKERLVKQVDRVNKNKIINNNYKYGFHLTITDIVSVERAKLYKITRILQKITSIKLFKGIELRKKTIGKMPNAGVFAIQYVQNIKLLILHVLLVIFVQRLGVSSCYKEKKLKLKLFEKIKLKLFLSPYVLNDFLPHISLLTPKKGYVSNLTKILRSEFVNHYLTNVETLCLVGRQGFKDNFKILKEFKLG